MGWRRICLRPCRNWPPPCKRQRGGAAPTGRGSAQTAPRRAPPRQAGPPPRAAAPPAAGFRWPPAAASGRARRTDPGHEQPASQVQRRAEVGGHSHVLLAVDGVGDRPAQPVQPEGTDHSSLPLAASARPQKRWVSKICSFYGRPRCHCHPWPLAHNSHRASGKNKARSPFARRACAPSDRGSGPCAVVV